MIRINTQQKYIQGCHKKDLFYNTKMPDHRLLNQELKNLKSKVDTYIVYKMQFWRPSVSQKECQHYIKTGEYKIQDDQPYLTIKQQQKTVLQHYNDFLDSKKEQFNGSESIKDYKSLGVALKKYQDATNTKLTFDKINDRDFFNRFKNHLSKSHNDNTTRKRIGNLKTFMLWVEEKELYNFKGYLYKFKVESFNPKYVTLNRQEIQEIQDLEIPNPRWQKIIDVFIANCFMSLRFKDLMSMEKGEFLQYEDGEYYFTKMNEKTNKPIEIPITKTTLAILQKYEFQLPKYTNQYFNRQLQKILKHYDLFNQKIKKIYIQGGEPQTKTFLKRELITSHTARRSYITNALSKNVPLTTIKLATGHTQLSTVSGYAQDVSNKEAIQAID